MVVMKMEGSSFRSYEGLGNRLSMESGGDRGAQMDPRFLAVKLDGCWCCLLSQGMLMDT